MQRIVTVANILTFARLVLLPVVIVGIATDNGWLAVGAMFAAWVTDLLDGRFARRMNQVETFGKALDSTVDFALIYCLFIAFYAAGRLATYQFAFLYMAMLSILSLQLFLTAIKRGDEVASTRLGKPTGALQYLYLLFLVVLEVLPENSTIDMAHHIYFNILALAIVANTVEIILLMARLSKAPAEPGVA
jgi:phosphatidylglycerophosphate synthase